MSEEQVLPEFIATLKAAAEKASPGEHAARYVPSEMPVKCVKYGVISLQSGLETCRVWERDDVEFYAAASPENILKLIASLAQSEAERERLQGELAGVRDTANFWLDAHARERERNQEARKVLRQIVDERDSELDMMTCPYDRRSMTSKAWHEGVSAMWQRLDIIKKPAIELLEPQPAPVATGEEQ